MLPRGVLPMIMQSESKDKTMATERINENKMGVMPVGKLLASMAIPMMISMLVQALYNVVDSVYVSRLGEDAFNAVSLAFPLQNLMIAVAGGTTVGMNALLSRYLGAKRQDDANRVAGTGIFLSICSAVVFSLIGIFCARIFFSVQTDVKDIVDAGTDYVTICLGCSAGIFLQFCFERLLQSTGRTTISMISQIIGAVINIVLDPILIFGKLGFPEMGVAGAAVATVTGQIVAAIVALVFNIILNRDISIKAKNIRPFKDTAGGIYKIGFPSIIMMSIGSVMTFCMNQILLTFNTTATAVFGAYFKLQSFIFMPIFGLNNGMVPIISYNFGAKYADRVHRTIKLTIISAVSIMFVGFALFELVPGPLLSIFDASDDMLDMGKTALRIIGTHYLLAGFCIISGSVCQAIGNPTHSLIVSVCRQLFVILPVAWLLSLTGNVDLVWLSFPAAELVSLILSTIFLKKTLRRADRVMAE